MSNNGINQRQYRVAIIGSGPAGFYAADFLLKNKDADVEVDMFDKLPTPHGLVRSGVAPDHQKIKSVTRVYDKTAANPRFRFFGYVEFGVDIVMDDLRRLYDAVIFATGAQTDRKLNIPGEDLKGSHTATEFVAWYNGHPEYTGHSFDLSQEKVVVIGVGNVAVDVARILSKTERELGETDIADYALESLRGSKIREVYILGRRGPLQAAFTNPEVRELGSLEDTEAVTYPHEIELDEHSRKHIEEKDDHSARKKIEILKSYTGGRADSDKKRKLHFRFLVSPVEFLGDEEGRLRAVKVVKNELYKSEDGSLRSRPTGEFEEIEAGLVFRSIGYHGVPLPDVPFHEKWGVIQNEQGRIQDPETGSSIPGLYVTGWIKRGPTGVIGTNKQDSNETVKCVLEDLENGVSLNPSNPDREEVEKLLKERKPDYLTYEDWLKLDAIEQEKGKAVGKPRVKFTNVEDMLEALKERR